MIWSRNASLAVFTTSTSGQLIDERCVLWSQIYRHSTNIWSIQQCVFVHSGRLCGPLLHEALAKQLPYSGALLGDRTCVPEGADGRAAAVGWGAEDAAAGSDEAEQREGAATADSWFRSWRQMKLYFHAQLLQRQLLTPSVCWWIECVSNRPRTDRQLTLTGTCHSDNPVFTLRTLTRFEPRSNSE